MTNAAVLTKKNSCCAVVMYGIAHWGPALGSFPRPLCGQGCGGLGLHGLHGLFHQALTAVFGNLAPVKAAFSMDSLDTVVSVC